MEDEKYIRYNKAAKQILFLVILFITLSITIIALMFYHNDKLVDQITERDKLINEMRVQDSLRHSNRKEYDSVVNQYVTPTSGLRIGDKEISLLDLVKMYSSLQDDYLTCLEQQTKLIDSVTMLNFITKEIESRYGIKPIITNNSKGKTLYLEGKRVDSGLMLLDSYRDKIEFDTVTKTWSVHKTIIQQR